MNGEWRGASGVASGALASSPAFSVGDLGMVARGRCRMIARGHVPIWRLKFDGWSLAFGAAQRIHRGQNADPPTRGACGRLNAKRSTPNAKVQRRTPRPVVADGNHSLPAAGQKIPRRAPSFVARRPKALHRGNDFRCPGQDSGRHPCWIFLCGPDLVCHGRCLDRFGRYFVRHGSYLVPHGDYLVRQGQCLFRRGQYFVGVRKYLVGCREYLVRPWKILCRPATIPFRSSKIPSPCPTIPCQPARIPCR
jgi:hypothetical protein